jgi:hypothetical protein
MSERDQADEAIASDGEGAARPPMEAYRYPDGSITYPGHPIGPGGEEPVGTVDLAEYTATVVTWTVSTATPPGVRQPNAIAVVEFDVDGEPVRAIGQLATGDASEGESEAGEAPSPGVEIGDEVRPVYAEELRDPDVGIRIAESQEWDGFRFEPT